MRFKTGSSIRIVTDSYSTGSYVINNDPVIEGNIFNLAGFDGVHYFIQDKDCIVYLDEDDFELVCEHEGQPKKYNDNKPMMSLIRPEFQLSLAEALTYGYTKYEEHRGDLQNYLKGDGFHYSTIIDSLERHLNAFKSGINIDEESGLEHLALAAANIMFLHTYEQCEKGIDDRIKLGDLDE